MMLEKVKEMKECLDEFNTTLKMYLTDVAAPLDERWEVYDEACNCGIIHSCHSNGYHLEILDKKDFTYDDLCLERYETISFVTFIERLSEDDHDYTEEEINNIKEDILQHESRWAGFSHDE